MKDQKKSFVLYTDSLDVLDMLSSEQIAELFLAIRDYQNDKEIDLSPMVKIAFSSFESAFKRDKVKWARIKDFRSKAGKKGGEKTQENNKLSSKAKQSEANQAVSVSDSVSESESVNVNTLIPYQDSNYSLDSSTGEIIQFPLAGRGEF